MRELLRTSGPGVISVIEGLLGGAAISYRVTDRSLSVLEGSIGALEFRILVPDVKRYRPETCSSTPSLALASGTDAKRRR